MEASQNVTALILPAPFGRRFVAHVLDFLLTNLVGFLLDYLVLGLAFLLRTWGLRQNIELDQALPPVVQQILSFIFSTSILYGYYVVWQSRTGATWGKSLLGLRVVSSEAGVVLSRRQWVLRWLGYTPSYLLMGGGFFMAYFNREGTALHDLIAKTRVIYERR